METLAATAGQAVCGMGSGAVKPREAYGALTIPQTLAAQIAFSGAEASPFVSARRHVVY